MGGFCFFFVYFFNFCYGKSHTYPRIEIIAWLFLCSSPKLDSYKVFVTFAHLSVEAYDRFRICPSCIPEHPHLMAQVFPRVVVCCLHVDAASRVPTLAYSSATNSSRLSIPKSKQGLCCIWLLGLLNLLNPALSSPSASLHPTEETSSGVLESRPHPRCVWWFHQHYLCCELEGGFTD